MIKAAIFSSLVGGLGHYCSHLTGPLSRHCQLKFITYPQTDISGTVVNELTDSFIKDKIKWPRFNLLENSPSSIVNVNAYLKQKQYQLINVHVGTTVKQKVIYFTSLLLYAKKINKLKVIFSLHDVLPFEEDRKLRNILKMFYGLADSFTVGNEQEADKLNKYFGIPSYKIHIIPHGIYDLFNQNQFSQKLARSYLNIPQDKKVILFFGWLREHKGFEYLVPAVNQLKKNEPKLGVYVASALKYTSPDATNKYLRLIKKLKVEDQFMLNFNYLDSRDIEPVFKAADVVVLPYTKVSQSGVLMLAMGFKKPVVITDVFYEKSWVAKRAGLVAENGNSQDLANKLRQLLQNPALANQYGENGYNYASRVFAWEKIAKQYYQAYRQAIEQ